MRPDRESERLAKTAERLARAAGGPLDIAVVLGSGLGTGFGRRDALGAIEYARLAGSPQAHLEGHPGVALLQRWGSHRVVLFAGRVHLYQGFSARDVTYFVRLAASAGIRTIVLTNAAGGLDPAFAPGDLMLIADQLNFTGTAPLLETEGFLSMADAYAPHLRVLAHRVEPSLREGIYAGVRGPAYETPAEAAALRNLGADAVGMSTVLETIAARALGLDVLGLSLIANAIARGRSVSHDEVLAAVAESSARFAAVVEAIVRALPPVT
ncbi:MAG: purine-nucleoside phosphorylase [Candidatus Baltobacteraceae bacterium]